MMNKILNGKIKNSIIFWDRLLQQGQKMMCEFDASLTNLEISLLYNFKKLTNF